MCACSADFPCDEAVIVQPLFDGDAVVLAIGKPMNEPRTERVDDVGSNSAV